jgi:hypothetical protein
METRINPAQNQTFIDVYSGQHSDPSFSRSLIGYSTLNFAKYRRIGFILLRFGWIVLAWPVIGHSLGTFFLAHLYSPSLTRLCAISLFP